jgi:hypothetical protein
MTPWSSSYITTNVQVPFWNNPSSDVLANGHLSNVGDVLAGLATGTNLIGGDLAGGIPLFTDTVSGSYYAVTSGSSGDPSTGGAAETVNGSAGMTTALAFNLTRNAAAYNIALLFADSSFDTGTGTGTVFGTYTGSGSTIALNPLFQPANNTTGAAVPEGAFNQASGTYGFYATVCYSVGNCETYTTGNGNFGTATGAQAWNHFALFQLASGSYVLGFEDTNGMFTEGIGDFNDIVVELQTTVPEPGTIAIMGLGLAALGVLGRRRFARK